MRPTHNDTQAQRLELERLRDELAEVKAQLKDERARRAALEAQLAADGRAAPEQGVLLRTLIDHLPDYIYIKDRQGRLIMNNAAHLRFLQVDSFDAVAHKTDIDLFPGELAQQFFAEEQRLMETGQALLNREEPIVDMAGVQRWISTSKLPLRDASGAIIGLVGVSSDITARKAAEAERERLQQQLIEQQRQTIRELSTPIIPLLDRIIVVPLVGALDTTRARDLVRNLLAGITRCRAKIVILDITGVPEVDTAVTAYLDRAVQSARLKGAKTIITGMSDQVVAAVVELGVDWGHITALPDLQSGLTAALGEVGLALTPRSERNSERLNAASRQP